MNLVADDGALLVDLHQARLNEAIHVRIEAAQARRQVGRKHMHRAVREVHRRRAIVGLLVEGTAFGHIVRDISDVDSEPVVTVLEPLDGDRIVEVARVFPVDGDSDARPEVGPALQVLVSNGCAQTACFFDCLDAVLVRQSRACG